MAKNNGHGGKRKGSGKPKGSKNKTGFKIGIKKDNKKVGF